MKIRVARPNDIVGLALLYQELSPGYSGSTDAIEAAIKHPATFVYVAIEGRKIVGTATLSVRAVPSVGYVGFVDDVVVHSGARHQGIGQALMDQMVMSATQLDCVRLELTSRPQRADAIRLYEKMGFKRASTDLFRLPL